MHCNFITWIMCVQLKDLNGHTLCSRDDRPPASFTADFCSSCVLRGSSECILMQQMEHVSEVAVPVFIFPQFHMSDCLKWRGGNGMAQHGCFISFPVKHNVLQELGLLGYYRFVQARVFTGIFFIFVNCYYCLKLLKKSPISHCFLKKHWHKHFKAVCLVVHSDWKCRETSRVLLWDPLQPLYCLCSISSPYQCFLSGRSSHFFLHFELLSAVFVQSFFLLTYIYVVWAPSLQCTLDGFTVFFKARKKFCLGGFKNLFLFLL